MCGRYAFFAPADALRRWFDLPQAPELPARYNIAPTQDVPVLRETAPGRREVALLRWGLVPSWAGDPSIGQRMINARAETLAERPAYRGAFRSRRCAVLASGWYEWQPTAAGKQPFFLRHRDGEPLAFAGLWERWVDRASGEAGQSSTIGPTPPPAPPGAGLAAGRQGETEPSPRPRPVTDPPHDGPQLIERLPAAG